MAREQGTRSKTWTNSAAASYLSRHWNWVYNFAFRALEDANRLITDAKSKLRTRLLSIAMTDKFSLEISGPKVVLLGKFSPIWGPVQRIMADHALRDDQNGFLNSHSLPLSCSCRPILPIPKFGSYSQSNGIPIPTELFSFPSHSQTRVTKQ